MTRPAARHDPSVTSATSRNPPAARTIVGLLTLRKQGFLKRLGKRAVDVPDTPVLDLAGNGVSNGGPVLPLDDPQRQVEPGGHLPR